MQLFPAFCSLMPLKQLLSTSSILSIIENTSWFIGFSFTHWLPTLEDEDLALFHHPAHTSFSHPLNFPEIVLGCIWLNLYLVFWLLQACILWFHFISCVTFLLSSWDVYFSFIYISWFEWTSCWVLLYVPKFLKYLSTQFFIKSVLSYNLSIPFYL